MNVAQSQEQPDISVKQPRRCSFCREPGHNVSNCNSHLIRKFKWRETAMERYERHHISNTSNQKFDIHDFKKNTIPVSEWN